MKIDGSCHCGQITYEAEISLEKVAVCHCTDCQKLSGSAFRTVVMVPDSDFTLLSGDIKTYVKTAESGNKRAQTFCGNCGAPLYATSVDDGPKIFGLRVGAISQRDQLVPKIQIWGEAALHWVPDIPGVKMLKKQS